MSAVKRAKEKEPRHVRLYHWLMGTDAWRDLDALDRCGYIEIAMRYGGPGSNNGRIPFSMSEMVDALHISKSTAHRIFADLQNHGFIVMAKQGGFNMKQRHSSEWRLTEFKDDVTGELATKDFTRWKKANPGSATVPHRVLLPNRTGTPVEQLPKVPMAYGSATVPDEPNDGSATVPLVVYQGGAPASARSSLSSGIPDPEEDEAAQLAIQTASKPPRLSSTENPELPSSRSRISPEEKIDSPLPAAISKPITLHSIIDEVLELIAGSELDAEAYLDKLKKLTPNDQVHAAKRDLAWSRRRVRNPRHDDPQPIAGVASSLMASLDRKRAR
jgi:hypothetical protein